ncbi:MAG TPA: hypothetical protein VH280_14905 [Verrucomicrobiae bacterium]|jgi:FtsH-binding integral membrane protein|nr:hypothetical protein [Verrucomicrobiae bacterium]
MSAKLFIGTALAVAIGTLIALAIAGVYAKQQLATATTGSTTLGSVLSLFGYKPTA